MHCTKEYNTESREKYNISVFDFQACTWLASLVALLFGVFTHYSLIYYNNFSTYFLPKFDQEPWAQL